MWKITLELYDGCVVYRKQAMGQTDAYNMWSHLRADATMINGSSLHLWKNGSHIETFYATREGHDTRGDWDDDDDDEDEDQSMKTVTVRMRPQYGRLVAYPVCSDARTFAAIAGTKTLTAAVLSGIRELGYEVVEQHGSAS